MEFRFRNKKYKWTCTVWQAVTFALIGVVGLTSWVYLLGSAPI